MNHEAAAPLIEDLLRGRLTGTTKDEMLSHLASCDECRSLSATFTALAEAWNDEALEHPSSDLIVGYALGKEALDPEVRDRVATHVLACERCANEVDVTNRAEAALAGVASPSRDRKVESAAGSRLLAPAVAAGLVLLVLAYPAYLGLLEVPRINGRLAALESETADRGSASWSGPARPVFLQSPVRGAGSDLPIVAPVAGQSHVTLAVVLGMLEDYTGAGSVRFAVRDAAGRTVWSTSLAEGELTRQAYGGTVFFLVPTGDLPQGRLTMSVARGADLSELVFEAPFRLETSE